MGVPRGRAECGRVAEASGVGSGEARAGSGLRGAGPVGRQKGWRHLRSAQHRQRKGRASDVDGSRVLAWVGRARREVFEPRLRGWKCTRAQVRVQGPGGASIVEKARANIKSCAGTERGSVRGWLGSCAGHGTHERAWDRSGAARGRAQRRPACVRICAFLTCKRA